MDAIDPDAIEIPREVLDMVTADVARMYRAVPVRFDKETGTLTVAMPDPTDLRVLEGLRFLLGCRARPVKADRDWLGAAIDEHYSQMGQHINRTILECESYRPFSLKAVLWRARATYHALAARVSDRFSPPSAGKLISAHWLAALAYAAPSVKLTKLILLAAVEEDAPRLVLDLSGNVCKVSLESDDDPPAGGERHEVASLSAKVARRVMRRIRRMTRWARRPESGERQGTLELTVRGGRSRYRVTAHSGDEGQRLRLELVERREAVGPEGEEAPALSGRLSGTCNRRR